MDYGARSQAQRKSRSKPLAVGASSTLGRLLDTVLTHEVPHHFFLHYYLVSVASSVFWAYQLWTRGRAVQALSRLQTRDRARDGMTLNQVWLCWSLMFVQGVRRLCESILYVKPTQATMPISIYAIGVLFYMMVNIAIWIEGLGKCTHVVVSHDQDVFVQCRLF